MPRDPFARFDQLARFEGAAGGWLAPILVFAVGAVLTVIAINGVHSVAMAPDPEPVPQRQPELQPVPAEQNFQPEPNAP